MASILIVDHRRIFSHILVPHLRAAHYTVEIVNDYEFLAALHANYYDVVILDFSESHSSDFTRLDTIRKLCFLCPQKTQILCLSKIYRSPSVWLDIERHGARWAEFVGSDFREVLREIELLLAESARLIMTGPKFQILHRFHQPGSICHVGEELAHIFLVNRAIRFPLNVSTSASLQFDFMARTRWLPQKAAQLARGLAKDAFTQYHRRYRPRRKLTYSPATVKVYMDRLRLELQSRLDEAAVQAVAEDVLKSESCGNEVRYKLHAEVEWVHLP